MSAKGLLSIVLHAHLPFIRHPEMDWALEEDWFFQAVTETYVPLILMVERLARENIRPALTISLSPTLCAMLEDELLEKRCRRYIETRLELVGEELCRHDEGSPQYRTAQVYAELYNNALDMLNRYSGDLITPFKQLQQNGLIEIITSSATHAILPLFIHPEAMRAQVAVAEQDYSERFSRKPRGMWLPECAYEPRVTHHMQLAGIKYFFLEDHALKFALPHPRYGIYAPAKIKGGMFACARDAQASKEVWSAQFGYPGDGAYRDFYRDIGFDAEEEYIKPFLHPDGVRRSTGLKYHRVTGNVGLADKEFYDPDAAAAMAKAHAEDFLKKRLAQMEQIHATHGIRPVITGTYDAELFGHWWFEGPLFLENVIRLIRQERLQLQTATASECLDAARAHTGEETEPDASSWGEGGYFEPWVNESNDWIYPRLNAASEKMIELANRFQFQDISHGERRALNQAARELLLAQSSDWAFLMHVGSHAEYARKRLLEHCDNFHKLARMVTEKNIDDTFLRDMESRHNIFFNINFRTFATASTF